MSDFSYLDAIILGIVQGLTEFLPVSSSAHLALVQGRLKLDPGSADMLLFDLLAHLGTLVAVGIVFATPARKFAGRLIREARSGWTAPRHAWRVASLAIIACVPTAILGFSLRSTIKEAFHRDGLIGACLIATGLCLALLAIVDRGKRGWREFHWWRAVLVGVAQGLAIFPGISRSGMTICAASYLGLRRRWAAEFSFLIAVPTIVGAALIESADTLAGASARDAAMPWMQIAVGCLVSFVVGLVALKLLLSAVRRGRLHLFAVYCWIVGGFVVTSGL